MSNVEMMEIEEYFSSKSELAQQAAPGAVYFGSETSVESEYDDDSGYYLTRTTYYTGLFDQEETELKIQDPEAYESFFDYVREKLSDDEESEEP